MKRAKVVVLLAGFLALYLTLVSGQCDQRDRGGPLTCCRGRNSSCAVEQYHDESNNKRPTRKVCFCDGFCELAGDCCPDFARVRQECEIEAVQDCVVSTWSRWSSCSHSCGVGRQKRHRAVIVKPSQGGGKTCPPLRQRRGCFMKHCGESAGMARVLPRRFQRLPSRYEKILPAKRKALKQERKKRPSYCAMFKIESKHPYCEGTWAKDLDPLTPICVECQDFAMDENGHCKGHGVMAELTSWDAVDIYSCHGEWLRIGPLVRKCSCNNKDFNNFIFV